jgi:hypothetical protein
MDGWTDGEKGRWKDVRTWAPTKIDLFHVVMNALYTKKLTFIFVENDLYFTNLY